MPKIKITLDRVEGNMAVLTTDLSGHVINLNLPVVFLPANAKTGEVFYLAVERDGDRTEVDKQTAKEILNEILKNQETGS